jgi:hypothetical protein
VLAAIALGLAAPSIARADEPAPAKAEGEKKPEKSASAKDKSDGPALDENGQPIHRYPPTGVRWGLIFGGATMTLGAYGASLAAAYGWPDVPGSERLKIPFIGPWWALAENACTPTDPDCGAILYIRGVLEVFSGIVQVSGLPLIGEGIFMTTEAAPKAAPDAPKKASLLPATIGIVPLVTPTTTGIGIFGTF